MNAKKEAVLEAGKRLFLEHGILQTSMEQIAEAVPVSKMTIYNYYQSKEGLLDHVVDRMIEELMSIYRDVMEQARDPLEALTIFYRDQEKFSVHVSQKFVTDLAKFPEQMEKLMQFNQKYVVPDFELLIFKGQQLGQIRKDISPQVLVAFMTFIKEFTARNEWYNGLGSINAVSEQLMTIMYYGIIQKDDPPHPT
ncbi:TetR/AcrR family transcriptional regulator [Paenibacillus glucanolyticus]|jgi:AcrR family transcriptional regulator|uniref:TetR/AcrR family transcriptional regulator n=1 Tax=Paenibacillus TaxID=44249 RepID=UPI0003E24B90|nr:MULTISPECIES: TetR/AcrR family transcriptional regulator [Paenibacillus]ANA81715.1 TetR family transcriptional regulator [Paenibacillus glucanolyticus]AVV59554.1 TetR/AcrR family transcriptional regulator [Paenibacillus glucanolyticus]ETT42151.1 TetR family transcriptional regulator [Paenibacillus sp. FSL R5-808]OMF68619.1 TetR family transcriptional regulator [Paenibacillus glucanolyticus]